jgi:hypothetical protein
VFIYLYIYIYIYIYIVCVCVCVCMGIMKWYDQLTCLFVNMKKSNFDFKMYSALYGWEVYIETFRTVNVIC